MLRRTLSALALASVLATTGIAQASATEGRGARVLDVMTFNIHHAQGTDDALDLQRIAEVVRRSGADVIGLQEVDNNYSGRSNWSDQPAELAAMLGYHVAFGANIDNEPPASAGTASSTARRSCPGTRSPHGTTPGCSSPLGRSSAGCCTPRSTSVAGPCSSTAPTSPPARRPTASSRPRSSST